MQFRNNSCDAAELALVVPIWKELSKDLAFGTSASAQRRGNERFTQPSSAFAADHHHGRGLMIDQIFRSPER